jgi:Dihydrofolate reductase
MTDLAGKKEILAGRSDMIEDVSDMTLSHRGHTVTVPARGWRSDETGVWTPSSEAMDLAGDISVILRARAAGLRITMVAAADEAWGIGLAGGLPWRCPEDLRHFRRRTMGGRLLMGRTTFEGLPATLDGRTVHILSSASADGFATMEGALANLAGQEGSEILVAGGGSVYAAALGYCTHAEVTRIPGHHGCDTFMPDLGKAGWNLARRERLAGSIEIEHWENMT